MIFKNKKKKDSGSSESNFGDDFSKEDNEWAIRYGHALNHKVRINYLDKIINAADEGNIRACMFLMKCASEFTLSAGKHALKLINNKNK